MSLWSFRASWRMRAAPCCGATLPVRSLRFRFATKSKPSGSTLSGNLMAAIHGVLKRLVDSKEAQRKPVKDGSVRYFWIGEPDQPTAPAPASPPVPAKQRPVVDVLAPGVSIGSLRTVMDDINELRKVTEGPAFRRGIIYLTPLTSGSRI
jgi:hypothetical protein